jgi:hypothetical protein
MLSVLVLAAPVMMLGLMMMMRRSVMMSGSRVMVFLRGMLRSLCHLGVPPLLMEFNSNCCIGFWFLSGL